MATVVEVLLSGSSWTVPSGVTSVIAHVFGPGGHGRRVTGTGAKSGGGSGGYSNKTFSVTPAASISYQVGDAGSGSATWFSDASDVLANGGATGAVAPGAGGATGVGDVTRAGADGGEANGNNTGGGGAGAPGPDGAGQVGGNAPEANTSGAGGDANGGTSVNAAGGVGSGSNGADGGFASLWTDNSGGPNDGLSVGPGRGSGAGWGQGFLAGNAGYGAGAGGQRSSSESGANGGSGLIVLIYETGDGEPARRAPRHSYWL